MKLKPKTKALIEKWAEALESGKYRQGQNYLIVKDTPKSKVKHCCLGVLCELIPGVEKVNPYVNDSFEYGAYSYKGHSQDVELPQSIVEEFGLNGNGFEFDTHGIKKLKKNRPELFAELAKCVENDPTMDDDSTLCMIDLNDKYGFKFKEIASILRGVYLEK